MKLELEYLDKNYIAFTKNNIDLIEFCISVDSSYRNAFNGKEGSSAELIKNHWDFRKEEIENIVKKIDKENSTHLAVSGYKTTTQDKSNNKNNEGIGEVVEKILSISDFEGRLRNADPNLVNEIAGADKNVSKFSFASKFCSYVSRYRFNNHNAYSIYDRVISEILPYYEWKYLGVEGIHARRKRNKLKEIVSTVKNFADKNKFDYEGYNKLIGEIIKAINNKEKIEVNRTIFDKILWYYYKGDEQLRKDALQEIPLP